MIALRQSTASQEVPLGYFLDSTDGDSEEVSLTIANTDIKLWKNGATALVNKNSGGATHMANGIYYAVLDATDTNTVGPMVIHVHVSGALPVRLECHVYEEAIFDSLFGASAAGFDASGRVNVGQWLGTAVSALVSGRVDASVGAMAANVLTATAIATDAITAAKIAANAIGASELAADAVSEIADQVWDEAKAGHVGAGSFGEEVQAHALSSEISALNDLSAAQVNAECDAALADIGLDHLLAASVTGTDVTDNSVFAKLVSGSVTADWDDFDWSTDSLEAISAQVAALPTAGQIVDQVWDEGIAGHVIAGSFGQQCGTDIDAILADTADMQPKLGTPAGADMSADIAAIQADLPVRLTKNTAYNNFTFMMLDSADGRTPKTGLTVTATRSIDGAAFGACANAVTEVANGWYKINLAASDLNGDNIALKFTAAGADATNIALITQST